MPGGGYAGMAGGYGGGGGGGYGGGYGAGAGGYGKHFTGNNIHYAIPWVVYREHFILLFISFGF